MRGALRGARFLSAGRGRGAGRPSEPPGPANRPRPPRRPASAGRGWHPAVPSADLDDLLALRPGAPDYGAKPTRGAGRGRGVLPFQASAPEADAAAAGDVIAPEPSRGRGRKPAAGAAERPRSRLPVEQAGLLSVERSAGRGAALKGAFERARAAFYETADASTADDDEPRLDGPRSRRDASGERPAMWEHRARVAP